MIKLSTIVPIYNKEVALRQTLQSVVDNHGIDDDEYECILVDDESTDSCPEICREFCTKYSYFKYVKIFNNHIKTPSDARNIGLKLSEGQYIHFLDADDLLCSKFYKEGLNILTTNNVNILVRGYSTIGKDGQWYYFNPTYFTKGIAGPPLHGCIFKRESIGSIKFEHIVSEDIVFSCLVLLNENNNYYDDCNNINSIIYMEKYNETVTNYKDIFDYDVTDDKYIVEFLQKYDKYPYKIENGEIVRK